ncbi:9004_t:CDS:2 [Acaulospora colombiana]|uniref:9004_t:CDS:1 n=1 Tax=Acaulospora colombiana TaxID=27376 RepID=A0ACA9NS80_9GLOM|nr:9004_t:CDS:2 [Acaulospora colombiana]
MPKDVEDEGKPPSYNRIRYRWIGDCLGGILDGAFSVKPPHSKILDLDKAFRDWDLGIPPSGEISAVQNGKMNEWIHTSHHTVAIDLRASGNW